MTKRNRWFLHCVDEAWFEPKKLLLIYWKFNIIIISLLDGDKKTQNRYWIFFVGLIDTTSIILSLFCYRLKTGLSIFQDAFHLRNFLPSSGSLFTKRSYFPELRNANSVSCAHSISSVRGRKNCCSFKDRPRSDTPLTYIGKGRKVSPFQCICRDRP